MTGASGIEKSIHILARLHVAGHAVGLRIGVLVHRLRHRADRHGARGRAGGDGVYLLFSRFYLKEVLKPSDVAGLALVVAGVLLVILSW